MPLTHNTLNPARLSLALLVLLLASLVVVLPGQSSEALAQTATPKTGVVCTTGATGNPSFLLTAKTGYISLPDGNTTFMWSYALGSGGFQLPGPTLCVNQGDNVTVTLNNTLIEDTSISFPALENVTVNGLPEQPQFDAGGNLTSLANVATKNGGTVTYKFVADKSGAFIYQSGTDQGKQINMGLFGALIVRPQATGLPALPTGAGYAYNRADSVFNLSTEYVMITSEIDPDLHQAVERNLPYDITKQHPRYWQINGRSFPDTIADNGAAWLSTQPYGSMVRIQPYNGDPASPGYNPYPALVHYMNVGMLNHPFHPHGNHGRIIGRDGRPMVSPTNEDLSYEKYLVLLGAGQTWDVTYKWTDVSGWDPVTKPIPVTVPLPQNLTYKGGVTWYSGSPYLGVKDDLPTGTTSYNQCGEYYQVWHSHALNEAANYDLGFGGMFTLQRIDPPLAKQQQTGHLCQ